MNNVLRVSSSILGENSASSLLTQELVEALAGKNESFIVTERNFSQTPIPHLDEQWLQALHADADSRSTEQQAKVAFSDGLIDEVIAADTLIIALPMYNFTVPSMLKAWIDHVARAGVTFAYTEQGPKGLLKDKKVYLVASTGGVHEVGVSDFLRPYMKLVMGFIGLTDVEIITASGLNLGPEQREAGLNAARKQIASLVAQAAA
jgi:FMN-dependent NADH-azoreductase